MLRTSTDVQNRGVCAFSHKARGFQSALLFLTPQNAAERQKCAFALRGAHDCGFAAIIYAAAKPPQAFGEAERPTRRAPPSHHYLALRQYAAAVQRLRSRKGKHERNRSYPPNVHDKRKQYLRRRSGACRNSRRISRSRER